MNFDFFSILLIVVFVILVIYFVYSFGEVFLNSVK